MSDRSPATPARRRVDERGDVERERPRVPGDRPRRPTTSGPMRPPRLPSVFMKPVMTPAWSRRDVEAHRPARAEGEVRRRQRQRQQHRFGDRRRRRRRREEQRRAREKRGEAEVTRPCAGRACAPASRCSQPPAMSATPASRNGSDAKNPPAEQREPQLARSDKSAAR